MSRELYHAVYIALKDAETKAHNAVGVADLNHLKTVERMGIATTVLGYITGALFFNPFSSYLIAIGHYTSWMIGHYVLHGAYDKIADVPQRFTSKGFAKGWRRFYDWFDWILPDAWKYEHNTLHHSQTSEKHDPDNVERLFKDIRKLRIPLFIKYIITILIAFTWKWIYYAPSTLMHLQKRQGKDISGSFNFYRLFNPFTKNGFEFWLKCLLPYFAYRFIAIPLCFLPFGKQAAFNALLTSILADLFSNFHGFLMIGPNHTGSDLYKFSESPKTKSMQWVHQIYCTTNYRMRGRIPDFVHGFVNYHIEHHLWPNLTVLQYKNLAGTVKQICLEYRIPYVCEPVTKRFVKLFDVCVGKSSIPVFEENLIN